MAEIRKYFGSAKNSRGVVMDVLNSNNLKNVAEFATKNVKFGFKVEVFKR